MPQGFPYQHRRDTAANWTSVNPVLLYGETGLETDTKLMKIGDGATAWTALAYTLRDGGSPSAPKNKQQIRRGTAAAWTSANPTLAAGEAGWESDTNKVKIGDGATAWVSLAYFAPAASGSVSAISMGAAPSVIAQGATIAKSCYFPIPAGALGARGAVRITAQIAGVTDATGWTIRAGLAGFNLGGVAGADYILMNNNNSSAGTGTCVVEALVYAPGNTTSLQAVPPGGSSILTTNNVVAPTNLTLNHGTTAWEIAIGGVGHAATGTWVVTNAECLVIQAS